MACGQITGKAGNNVGLDFSNITCDPEGFRLACRQVTDIFYKEILGLKFPISKIPYLYYSTVMNFLEF